MSPDDFDMLLPSLTAGVICKGTTLFRAGEKIDTVWFLESGVGSLVLISPNGDQVEIGMFGREGFAPVSAVLGADQQSNDGVIHIKAEHYKLNVDQLRASIDKSERLRALLLSYAQTMFTQVSQTALSCGIHRVDVRLARWLLMYCDRLGCGSAHLTHEFLSTMLAVHRPAVTIALKVLESERLIRAERGHVTVLDRPRLKAFARDSYGLPEMEYQRLIGSEREQD